MGLPEGWVEKQSSSSGHTYYENTATGKTS